MELKDRMKHLRAENKTSARTLAIHLDKAESTIRMWESGRNKPDADTLIQLADYFDCSTDYLLGLSNNKKEEPSKHTLKTLRGTKHDLKNPDIQIVLADQAFNIFVHDLILALCHNKGKYETELYLLLNEIIRLDENEYRTWGSELFDVWQLNRDIFKLDNLDTSKKGERRLTQVLAYVRDLSHAQILCNRVNEEADMVALENPKAE